MLYVLTYFVRLLMMYNVDRRPSRPNERINKNSDQYLRRCKVYQYSPPPIEDDNFNLG